SHCSGGSRLISPSPHAGGASSSQISGASSDSQGFSTIGGMIEMISSLALLPPELGAAPVPFPTSTSPSPSPSPIPPGAAHISELNATTSRPAPDQHRSIDLSGSAFLSRARRKMQRRCSNRGRESYIENS